MKRKLKPGALVAPVPAVMVSCGDMENPNIITIAWCGTTGEVGRGNGCHPSLWMRDQR